MMRILVSGAGGQVGKSLASMADRYGFKDCFALVREQIDITSVESLSAAFDRVKPDLVINAAAYTSVDKAESEVEKAFMSNEYGPQLLAQFCNSVDIPLFHISTDYVFDGALDRPYLEVDEVAPQGIYAQSKEAGERRIREIIERHIILRTSWVFSKDGACFPRSILRAAKQRRNLKVVDDQVGGPTSANSIANTLFLLAEKYKSEGELVWGTYHYSQEPYVTWYQFATKIIESAYKSRLIEHRVIIDPCTSEYYAAPVKRPPNSRLDAGKLRSLLGREANSWEVDLKEVISSQVNSLNLEV